MFTDFRNTMSHLIKLSLFLSETVNANVWCYSCVSMQPGCDEFYVDWRVSARRCLDTINLIDSDSSFALQKHGNGITKLKNELIQKPSHHRKRTLVTRDCLSNSVGLRSNIPANTFEGCYPREQRHQRAGPRDYYDTVNYCFCGLDNWCNGLFAVKPSSVFYLCRLPSASPTLQLQICWKKTSVYRILTEFTFYWSPMEFDRENFDLEWACQKSHWN